MHSILLTYVMLASIHLRQGPASFPIFSIVKLARKWVLLEISVSLESHLWPSNETLGNYTKDAAVKFLLCFKFHSFHSFGL